MKYAAICERINETHSAWVVAKGRNKYMGHCFDPIYMVIVNTHHVCREFELVSYPSFPGPENSQIALNN